MMRTGVAAAQQPSMLEFTGICDASGAVALDENRIIVGDDENPWLSIYRLDTLQLEAQLPLNLPAIGPVTTPKKPPEADIEAATVVDGRLIWITSHGRNSKGEPKPERAQIFATHRLNEDGTGWTQFPPVPFGGLLQAILAESAEEYAPLRDAIGDLAKPNEDL